MGRNIVIWSLVLALALLGLPGSLLAGLALLATCLSFAVLEVQESGQRHDGRDGVLRA